MKRVYENGIDRARLINDDISPARDPKNIKHVPRKWICFAVRYLAIPFLPISVRFRADNHLLFQQPLCTVCETK